MLRQLIPLLFLASCALASLNPNATNDVKEEARRRRFAVFNVVKFPNDGCSGNDNRNGTCYTESECSDRDGTNSGTCADGYGVCCIFILECGMKSSENSTYFQSTGSESGHCKAEFCSVNSNICQLRLDFQSFVINQPSTDTVSIVKHFNGVVVGAGGVALAAATQCNTDSFAVLNGRGSAPSPICGTNSNEHMYVDTTRGGCAFLYFTLGTAAVSRSWNIKVSQYECGYENRAPQGCTKYYFGASTGEIKTYNFDQGLHLASQRDTMCIRRERGNCRICYYTATNIDFDTAGAVMAPIKVGKSSKCCGYGMDGVTGVSYDCAVIPGASKTTANSMLMTGNEFCGGGLAALVGGLATISGNVPKTICSKALPFQVTFLSDHYENSIDEAAAMNNGFKLQYTQTTCK